MNTEQLKAVALKATPGPWEAQLDETYNVLGPDGGRVAMMMNLKGAHGMAGRRTGEESAANCRMIAAANPSTILALLECVDALKFYADPATYRANGHTQIDADLTPIKQDRGERARAALKGAS